jgi:hypothetical protein
LAEINLAYNNLMPDRFDSSARMGWERPLLRMCESGMGKMVGAKNDPTIYTLSGTLAASAWAIFLVEGSPGLPCSFALHESIAPALDKSRIDDTMIQIVQ